MRVLLRADASPVQGTGHVMRCLTLSEELVRRGHEVILLTNESGVPWLEEIIVNSNLQIEITQQHELEIENCLIGEADWIVVDSYEISAATVSQLSTRVKVLAIVDGDTRGIDATMYLDHNLGAEKAIWPIESGQIMLAGSKYALIRDAILSEMRPRPWQFQQDVPHIFAVMGGSDPTGSIVSVARALSELSDQLTATIIVNPQWQDDVKSALEGKSHIRVIPPTPNLSELIGSADIAISASGTSAWELCTLGIPSLLVAVVDNQRESLAQLVEERLVLGIDASRGGSTELSTEIARMVRELISTPQLRKNLSDNCLAIFDGLGKKRIVDAMEKSEVQ